MDCHNQAAIHKACNPIFHEHTKHIKVASHLIEEKMCRGCICTPFTTSEDQLADISPKLFHMKRCPIFGITWAC